MRWILAELAVRAMNVAVAALALRTAPASSSQRQRRLVPAVDGADAALLGRTMLSQQRAALIASLWPAPTRQCVTPPLFELLPSPAAFGALIQVSWRPPPPAAAPASPAPMAA